MMAEQVLRFRLSQGITIGIDRTPDSRKPLRIYAGSKANSHEDLSNEQIDELMTMCLYVRRWGREKKTRYPWTTRVPATTRFGSDVIVLFGRLDRAFKSGQDSVE